jgi:hypothetical protein
MNPHPEVFKPATPVNFEGTRTVYPPCPDIDGLYALSEVLDWAALMNDVHKVMRRTCALLRHEIAAMPTESAARVQECLHQIERMMPLFLRRDLALIPEQQRCKDIFGMFYSAAMVWAGRKDCLESFARFITGSSDKWLALSSALVENHLKGQKDWRHSYSPVKWVKGVTNNIAEKESRTSHYAVDPSNEPDTVSLEEIAELPIEGLLQRRYSYQSVGELEAAAKEDPETAAFLSCKIHNPSWSCEAISRHLGWDERHGKRVDRRCRRLRNRFKELGAGIQCREYGPPPGITEANCTTYFEELYDGSRGRRTGVWQHRDSQL